MNNRQQILNLLGIAQRAGKIVSGEQSIFLNSKKIYLLFVANNISKNSYTKVKKINEPIIDQFNSFELSNAIGKTRKLIGLTDKGLANKIISLIK